MLLYVRWEWALQDRCFCQVQHHFSGQQTDGQSSRVIYSFPMEKKHQWWDGGPHGVYNFPLFLYLWEGDSLVYAWFHELHIKRGCSLVELKEKYITLSFVLCCAMSESRNFVFLCAEENELGVCIFVYLMLFVQWGPCNYECMKGI